MSEFSPDDYGWDGITRIRATVRIRETNPHNGGEARPEAKQLEGYTGSFTFAWQMDDDDPYPGEIAFMPDAQRGEGWPWDAPGWIASGDLEIHGEQEDGT